MGDGNVNESNKTGIINYVWPVRSGQYGTFGSLTLPRTGQTTCYNVTGTAISCSGTGLDGELQTGTVWPTPRFIDNSIVNINDKTVTDNLTGLIWSKDANLATTTKTWQGALDYIKTLNSINYLGHNDWRLPNVNELASMVNRGQIVQANWLNGQGFSNVESKGYWSSSSYALSKDNAWIVYMTDGYVYNYYSKTGNIYYVWPVRGGQSGASASLTLSAVKSGTGSGIVASSTGGISCGSTCSASITSGTSITLTATPDSGSIFTGWSGACSGTATTCTVTMDAAKSVTATFSANIVTWTINFGSSGNGTVSCTSPVNNGATSTCTVTPTTGYQLSSFTDNSVDMKSSVTGSSYSITSVTANHTIAATFTLIPLTPVNGSCGSNHGATLSATPSTGLCTTGTTASIAGSGPWVWTCSGANGGTSTICAAYGSATAATTKAKIFLDANDSFTVSSSGATICHRRPENASKRAS